MESQEERYGSDDLGYLKCCEKKSHTMFRDWIGGGELLTLLGPQHQETHDEMCEFACKLLYTN